MGGDGVIFALKAPEGKLSQVSQGIFKLDVEKLCLLSLHFFVQKASNSIFAPFYCYYYYNKIKHYLSEGGYDFTMRIYNSDGSEPEMCGNGIRCFAQFLKDLGADGECVVFIISYFIL